MSIQYYMHVAPVSDDCIVLVPVWYKSDTPLWFWEN